MTSLPVPLSPSDQHRGVGLGDMLDQLHDLAHGRAVADDLVDRDQPVDGLAQLHVLLLEPPLLQCLLNQMTQLVRIDGLGDVVEGTVLQRPHGRVHRGEGGDHDDRRILVDPMDVFLQFDAVHAGHLDVDQGHVVSSVLQRLQGLGGVLHRFDLVSVLAEPVIE